LLGDTKNRQTGLGTEKKKHSGDGSQTNRTQGENFRRGKRGLTVFSCVGTIGPYPMGVGFTCDGEGGRGGGKSGQKQRVHKKRGPTGS